MKSLSLIFAAVIIAFSFPACATHKQADSCCSSGGSCDAPDTKAKTTASHTHAEKKSN